MSVNATDRAGSTALHTAVYFDRPEIADLLIEYGADVTVADKDGWTPLHVAAIGDWVEVAAILVAAGADLAAKDKEARTPLDLAVAAPNADAARLLVDNGGEWTVEAAALVNQVDTLKGLAAASAGHPERGKAALAIAAGAETACILNINENTWSYYNGWWHGSNRDLWTQNVVQNIPQNSGAGYPDDGGPVSLGQISVRAEVSAAFELK